MKLFPLAIAAALLPLATVHLCYFIAAYHGHVPWCIPYLESCTSISAAGRQSPEFFVYKGLMIPSITVLACYWLGVFYWHRHLQPGKASVSGAVLVLALTACLGLILYSVMLGALGDTSRWQRRLGIITFFALTYFAQTILAVNLRRQPEFNTCYRQELLSLWGIAILVLLTGLFAVAFSAYDESAYDRIEDALEWIVTLVLSLQPLVIARLWMKTKFRIDFSLSQPK